MSKIKHRVSSNLRRACSASPDVKTSTSNPCATRSRSMASSIPESIVHYGDQLFCHSEGFPDIAWRPRRRWVCASCCSPLQCWKKEPQTRASKRGALRCRARPSCERPTGRARTRLTLPGYGGYGRITVSSASPFYGRPSDAAGLQVSGKTLMPDCGRALTDALAWHVRPKPSRGQLRVKDGPRGHVRRASVAPPIRDGLAAARKSAGPRHKETSPPKHRSGSSRRRHLLKFGDCIEVIDPRLL